MIQRDWSFFEDDIIKSLPFVWRTREDTSMYTAFFDRNRSFGNPENADDDNFEESRTFYKRNVLVARSTHGIEVLHLYR